MIIGYHCSHEQHAPSALLGNVQRALRAGFTAAMCSDHFAPWSLGEGQGQSGFAWSWLGAALATTERVPFGVVTAPGQRYHPAIIAQAAATLADLAPGRFWMAVGSGEALNEHITGAPWPAKARRMERLRECVDVIRALFRGETVNHEGLVTVHEARLYPRPANPPPIIGAAISLETAVWMAPWVDGLITTARPHAELERFVARFREAGGAGKPLYVQAPVAWGRDEASAEREALRAWGPTLVGSAAFKADTLYPEYFDMAVASVGREELRRSVRISASLAQHEDWLAQDRALGVDGVFLHHVPRAQDEFIAAFAPLAARLR